MISLTGGNFSNMTQGSCIVIGRFLRWLQYISSCISLCLYRAVTFILSIIMLVLGTYTIVTAHVEPIHIYLMKQAHLVDRGFKRYS